MKHLSKFYSSIPLVLTAALLFKLCFREQSDDSCDGLVEGFGIFLLAALYVILLIIILIVAAYRIGKSRQRMNYNPLLTTGILILLFVGIKLIISLPSKNNVPLLYASNRRCAHYVCFRSLELNQNGRFEAIESDIDWGCHHKGAYLFKGDTITLERNLQKVTDSAFSNQYVINRAKNILSPVHSGKLSGDSTECLIISEKPSSK
jgi:hypothetical protein